MNRFPQTYYLAGLRIHYYDNDEALMRGLREGETGAFDQVYHRFYRPLYFFAHRFVGSEDAYDILADVFIQLWNHRAGFTASAAVQQWLFVTVRNRCLSLLKRQARQHDVRAELLHLLETSEESILYQEEITTEIIALLHREIDRLPARQREVFLLSFRDGLKPSQIAEQLSLSVKTVKNQKLNAIRLLQSVLGQRVVLLSLLVLLQEESGVALPI